MNNHIKITDPKGIKTSELLAKCKKFFPVWSWYSDEQIDKDFPAPKKSTTRYFKNVQEADEQWKNKSAKDLEKEWGVKPDGGDKVGITLRERILLEISYFQETGKHLDLDNWTLCSGSRDSGGDVPCARWGGDRFEVRWNSPAYRSGDLRPRQAISPSDFESSSSLSETDKITEAIKVVKEAGYKVIKIL